MKTFIFKGSTLKFPSHKAESFLYTSITNILYKFDEIIKTRYSLKKQDYNESLKLINQFN